MGIAAAVEELCRTDPMVVPDAIFTEATVVAILAGIAGHGTVVASATLATALALAVDQMNSHRTAEAIILGISLYTPHHAKDE